MHQVIQDEIFNLQYRISDQAIEYIQDELNKYRCVIDKIEDNDAIVTIYFSRKSSDLPDVEGELRINRIESNFEIVGCCSGYILPVIGTWEEVLEYLEQLVVTE